MRRLFCVLVVMAIGQALLFSLQTASAQDLRTAVDELADRIAKNAPGGKQLRIAVIDFPDLQGVTSDLGRYIASRLTTRLAQSPRFFVIERQRLNQVLAELRFSMSDLVDPAKAKQLGNMAGVEAIAVGTVSDLGNQVDLDARMIEIETNRLLLGATITISKDPAVTSLLERGRQEAAVAQPGLGSAVPTPGVAPPRGLQGFRYNDKAFAFELTTAEVTGDEIKLTFLYTNRQDDPGEGYMDINSTYLVDNLGNRYRYTGDSFDKRRVFPPQIQEQIWITFAKLRPGATSANLVLSWCAKGLDVCFKSVVIRNIPLRR